MKLRNKQTGEIGYTAVLRSKAIVVMDENAIQLGSYTSLAELNAEWEDVPEEPKEWWYIDIHGPHKVTNNDEYYQQVKAASKEIGNYFESPEEAELALRKLKAWKRLRDKGFRPRMWEWEYIYDDNISGELIIKAHIDDATDSDGKYTKDLDLLFGGEE